MSCGLEGPFIVVFEGRGGDGYPFSLVCVLTKFVCSCSRASLQQRLALNEARRKNIDQQLLEMQHSVVS